MSKKNGPPRFGFLPRDPGKPLNHRLPDQRRDLVVGVVLLQFFATGGGLEVIAFDDRPREPRPAGHEVPFIVADQHAADIDGDVAVVRSRVAGAILDPDQAPDPVGLVVRQGQADQRLENRLEPPGELHFDATLSNHRHFRVEPPRDLLRVYRCARVPEVHGDPQQRTETAKETFDHRFVRELMKARTEMQLDSGADRSARRRLQGVSLSILAAELPRFVGPLIGSRRQVDPVTHDVRRQKTETEVTDEPCLSVGRTQLPSVAGSDSRKVALDLIGRETGPRVFDRKNVTSKIASNGDFRLEGVPRFEPSADTGVVRILDELPQRDGRRRVEVFAQGHRAGRQD